jgi:hypothetical protein
MGRLCPTWVRRSGWNAGVEQVTCTGWGAGVVGRHGENDEQGVGSLPTWAGIGRTAWVAKDSAHARKKGE